MKSIARLVFIPMLIVFAARVGALTVPYETWMGTYIGEKKVGYLSLKIDKTERDGVPGYRIASVLNNRLTVLGSELTQLVTSIVYADSTYRPLSEDYVMSSGGKTTKVRATFKADEIEYVFSAGGGSTTRTIPIPQGTNLVGDALFALVDKLPELGKEYCLHYFNPLSLTLDELKLTVERKEKIKIGSKDYDTLVLKNVTPMGVMTVWQEPNGDILQVTAMMGIKMVRQPQQEAMSGIESGKQEDFAILSSVKPNVTITSPRRVKSLQATLMGLSDASMAFSDSRQKAVPVDGRAEDFDFTINAASFTADDALQLPIADPELADYLGSTAYLDYGVPAVKEQAANIVGDDKNSYSACSSIRKWVNQNLHSRADIGITRAASDVLKSKVGVCRDYAILFAALARSAGIPTKVVSGLLYTDGAFYYHAWVECYIGSWVPFDATMSTDFVDATHIKLAEGDATSMFALAKVIGSLKVNVKEFK